MVLVLTTGLLLAVIRLAGPCDLTDNYHQERAGAYVLDVLLNDHWVVQRGIRGELSTKPPLYTWLAGLAHLPCHRANWFALVAPATLTTLGISVLLWHAGRRRFGENAGLAAALVFLVSPIGAKQMGLARIDGVFSFTILLTALLAFRCWSRGGGWAWFWLAGAVATLAKGPFGLVLGAAGLLAVFWERRSGSPAPLRGRFGPGILLFSLVAGGWFALALSQAGPDLAKTLLSDELTKHAVGGRDNQIPLIGFYYPPLYFLSRFLPWSLLFLLAVWQVWRQPSALDSERRFERFLVAMFFSGLALLALAAHQRDDLIFPLIPPAALLAGREAARRFAPLPLPRARTLLGGAVALGLVMASLQYHLAKRSNPLVERTRAVESLARLLEDRLGYQYPLHHVDSPASLQFFLNTKRPLVTLEQAATLLRGPKPAFVVLTQEKPLRELLGADAVRITTLQKINLGKGQSLSLLANVPELNSPTLAPTPTQPHP